VTVTVAVALVVSLDAVIVTVPGPTAVTSPFGDTRATRVLVDAQLIGRLAIVWPSRALAETSSCTSPPALMVARAGEISSVAIDGSASPTAGSPVC
jgi:hypothetical protein